MKLLWNGAGGFIRCDLNEHTRFHIYDPGLPPTVSPDAGAIHDHRFIMSSRVLLGKLTHYVYNVEVDENGGHETYHVIDDHFHFLDYVTVSCAGLTEIKLGEDFTFGGPNWFHRVVPSKLTITCMTRTADASMGEPAKILVNRDVTPQNAFASNKSPTDDDMESVVRSAIHQLIYDRVKV